METLSNNLFLYEGGQNKCGFSCFYMDIGLTDATLVRSDVKVTEAGGILA